MWTQQNHRRRRAVALTPKVELICLMDAGEKKVKISTVSSQRRARLELHLLASSVTWLLLPSATVMTPDPWEKLHFWSLPSSLLLPLSSFLLPSPPSSFLLPPISSVLLSPLSSSFLLLPPLSSSPLNRGLLGSCTRLPVSKYLMLLTER